MASNQEDIAEGHLSACEQENRELRAEVERLQAQVLRALDEPTRNQHDLWAENQRLRAALEGVIAEADRKTAAFDRARAALARPKEC